MTKKTDTILITGAAGFIGSCMAASLNAQGYQQLLLVDDFSVERKKNNHQHLQYLEKIDRKTLAIWLQEAGKIDQVIHLGARTDTTEMNYTVHEELNLNYSKMIWQYCTAHQVPLIYASSAATYGDGQMGYDDDEGLIEKLHPLNPYGVSKNEFDKWAVAEQTKGNHPPHWYGLKFFNVYGPNEYHKGRMASVIFHAFHQISNTGKMILFRSHHPDYIDGGQMRDFVYVKDLLKVMHWLTQNQTVSGIYNLGSGKARTFLDLAQATFDALGKTRDISFVDTPADIRDKYQYFTEAAMQKLKNAGYTDDFYPLEAGIQDYVQQYLQARKYY